MCMLSPSANYLAKNISTILKYIKKQQFKLVCNIDFRRNFFIGHSWVKPPTSCQMFVMPPGGTEL